MTETVFTAHIGVYCIMQHEKGTGSGCVWGYGQQYWSGPQGSGRQEGGAGLVFRNGLPCVVL